MSLGVNSYLRSLCRVIVKSPETQESGLEMKAVETIVLCANLLRSSKERLNIDPRVEESVNPMVFPSEPQPVQKQCYIF